MGEHFDSDVDRGYSIDNLEGEGPPGSEEDDSPESGGAGIGNVTLRAPEPNPSATSFLVEFELGDAMPVALSVYDVNGRRVAVLVAGILGAGPHSMCWAPGLDGWPEVPPGLYFVRLASRHELHTAKVVLIQ
jgi:hypothetical protein